MDSGDGDKKLNSGKRSAGIGLIVAFVFVLVVCPAGIAATVSTHSLTPHKSKSQKISESQHARRRMRHLAHARAAVAPTTSASLHRRHRYYERFSTSSFAQDITEGDVTAGEDAIVRDAAIDALGDMNGTVVAIEPTSGRILAMVNQKLALSSGAQPCSTIKLSVALAALNEGIITKETEVRLGGRYHMNLTMALAHSNNAYFEALGRQLGFEKVSYYAHQYGLGELAGYSIPGEQLGIYPNAEIPSKLGGVGKMCSFGEGVSVTPLQLGALVSAIANGGTLYYLQHPTAPEEIANFQPVVKRRLDIAPLIPEISDGMEGAVQSARPAVYASISARKKFWARPEPVPMRARVSGGLPLTRRPMLVTSWSSSFWKAVVQPSAPRRRKLPAGCIAISMITTSSWRNRRTPRP